MKQRRCPSSHILVADAMKPITPKTPLFPFVGTGIEGTLFGQGAVESGIENSQLRHGAELFFHRANALQSDAIMQGGQLREGLDIALNLLRNRRRLPLLSPSMNHPMPHDRNDFTFGQHRKLFDGSQHKPYRMDG